MVSEVTCVACVNCRACSKAFCPVDKGGVVIGISDQFHIPVRYIGIGEGIDQLRIFDRKEFVKALFGDGSGQS